MAAERGRSTWSLDRGYRPLRWLLKRTAATILGLMWTAFLAASLLETSSSLAAVLVASAMIVLVSWFGYPGLLVYWLPFPYSTVLMRRFVSITFAAALVTISLEAIYGSWPVPIWVAVIGGTAAAVTTLGLFVLVPISAARALASAEMDVGIGSSASLEATWRGFLTAPIGGLARIHRRVRAIAPHLPYAAV